MKLKNVKKGARVEAKVDIDDVVPRGAQGVIIEDGDFYPYVSWETLHKRVIKLGYVNVWAVSVGNIRMVKE